ncbi:molybdopterin-binding protein [uncultured Clostridium sp.]|uniref:molybdopterin-binding protein n=1 Tax=uncultured Clostridium sp. TaxID=59620 RepID=UPI0025DF6DD1|nr:molybdopterin-binding protein [uncultured Clostridium sp.]
MKLIRTENAIGHVLCHDMTQIIPGKKKDAVFKKGHIVTEEDIPVLLSMGKDNLYVWEKKEGILHENEAAEILYRICKNDNMKGSDVKEGKIELIAEIDGLFKVDTERLNKINGIGEMMIATRHGNFPIKKGDKLAGTRIIPLIIEEKKMKHAVELAGDEPILQLLPFNKKRAVIITTGNEVFYGRIKDAFGPVIREKLAEYDVEVLGQKILNDNPSLITEEIKKSINDGADLIICTGGMSVDPDDTTPTAIKNTGAQIISYGAPVLPGAMFLLAYFQENIPIMGLPGCVMYNKRTIFDLVLPRIIADDKITQKDLSVLGEGGLCLGCSQCTFPNCGFGK